MPPTPPPEVDDKLTVMGQLCTEPADVTPFPVKILFLIDQSASLQCTDSRNRRFQALNRVVNELLPLPQVFFGFVGFASWSRTQPFTREQDAIRPFLDPGQGLGPATDYQGALATAVRMLERDLIDSGPAVRARTRYVVVFVSDGAPEPRCRAGCEDDRAACSDGVDNDADGLADGSDPDCDDQDDNSLRPDNLYPVCNTDREIAEGTYVDMQGRCPEYNMPRQILQRIDDLRSLEIAYSAGDIALNTVLITSPQAVIDAVCPGGQTNFGYNFEQARQLLTGMAEAGGGTFRDVNLEREDDTFLDFDFTSLRAPYFVTEFSAINVNAAPGASGPLADSDRDGLPDVDEPVGVTSAFDADSDGDGYGDLIETRFARSGFDPLDPEAPARPCRGEQAQDMDGDGLRACEEAFLQTDPLQPDTDGDRILDGVELRLGSDPRVADAEADPDFDGVITREEVRGGTDPLAPDADRHRAEAIRYALVDRGELPVADRQNGRPVLRRCYDFEVRDIRLVAGAQRQDRGRNRVVMSLFGEPVGVGGSPPAVRQGCVEAIYQGSGLKRPESGVVDLRAETWAELRTGLDSRFDDIARCIGVEPLDLTREQVENVIDACLPPRVAVENLLLPRDELKTLLRQYARGDLTSTLPVEASDLFWPAASFDPEAHCYRPWEVDRLRSFLATLADACAACPEVAAGGDAGLDAGAADAEAP
ncbi:MAG: VWA domain-containing protein [Myxococcales bacterium]|nr:VWA domain-containing protein [Myxococcales bacterium]